MYCLQCVYSGLFLQDEGEKLQPMDTYVISQLKQEKQELKDGKHACTVQFSNNNRIFQVNGFKQKIKLK